MKKKVLCGIISASLALSCGMVYAEENDSGAVSESELQTESEEIVFTFRDIPWFTTRAEADKIFEEDGAKKSTYENCAYRMSGIDYISVTTGEDRVEGGGIISRYSGLNVAGYDVSNTFAAYIYTIDDDGVINKSNDDAELYFGWYTFSANDFVDGEEIYEDLGQKLESLYGEGEVEDESEYNSTITWYDTDNNQIRLLLGGKSSEKYYVTLGYMVANADDLLDEMQDALDAEAAAQEALDREENKENTSGL